MSKAFSWQETILRNEIEAQVEEEDDDALYEALGEDNNDLDEDQFESILIFKKEERVQSLMKRRLLSMLLSKTSDMSQLDESCLEIASGYTILNSTLCNWRIVFCKDIWGYYLFQTGDSWLDRVKQLPTL